MGTLERLQNGVCEILKAIGDLRFATIRTQNDYLDSDGNSAEGLEVRVMRPMPISASKYAAGPTFSAVELRIEVTRAKYTAQNAPSLLTSCEIISRALHGVNAPVECGYGRIALAENSPWDESKTDSQSEKINLRFCVQSVLQ